MQYFDYSYSIKKSSWPITNKLIGVLFGSKLYTFIWHNCIVFYFRLLQKA